MGAFTKGPWFYVKSMTAEECGLPGGKAADVLVEDDDTSENRAVMGISILDDLTDDDARLIAAAPDLYEALKPFAEPHAMGDNYVQFAPRLIAIARAALAKAIGTKLP